MKDMGIQRLSFPCRARKRTIARLVDQVDNPETFQYLTKRVTEAKTGISELVNGQAVIAQLRKLLKQRTLLRRRERV